MMATMAHFHHSYYPQRNPYTMASVGYSPSAYLGYSNRMPEVWADLIDSEGRVYHLDEYGQRVYRRTVSGVTPTQSVQKSDARVDAKEPAKPKRTSYRARQKAAREKLDKRWT